MTGLKPASSSSGGGLSPIASHTALCNATGSSATPTACTASDFVTTGITQDSTNVNITGGNITGTNRATQSVQGAMSPTDKTKLDGLNSFTEYTNTLASPGQAVELSVAGDADGSYDLEGMLTIGATCNGLFEFNAVTTQQNAVAFNRLNGLAAETNFYFARAGASPIALASTNVLYVQGHADVKSGRIRQIYIRAFLTVSGTATDQYEIQGTWADTADAVTKIGFYCSASNCFSTGSWLRATARQTNF